MLDAQALYDRRWEDSAGKRTPEDVVELHIQATDTQGLKVQRLVLEQLIGGIALLPGDLDGGVGCNKESSYVTAWMAADQQQPTEASQVNR